MGLIAMLPNYNPACRKSFTIVETVKEASAVCRSFLDGVVILFYKDYWKKLQIQGMQGYSESEGISYQTSILKIKKGLGESLKM